MMDSIELLLPDLYGNASEKLAAAKQIASLCVDIPVLEYVAQHDQLISALDRLLSSAFDKLTDDGLSLDLGFTIGKIVLALSEVEDFHEILSNHRIGANLLYHLCSSNEKLISNESSDRRENFVMICLRVLANLAYNVGTLKKMIKKGLVPLVVRCLLNMKSRKSHLVSLQLLKRCSVFEETAIEIASHGRDVIPMLVRLLNNVSTEMHSDVITTLFNLSFLEDCLYLISDVDGIHSCLVSKLHEESRAISLLYHLSSKQGNRNKLFAAGISDYLMHEIKKATTKEEMDEALAGLLVNMTRHSLCAECFVLNDIIRVLMRTLREGSTSDFTLQILLKVTRNLSSWTRKIQCKIESAIESGDMTCLAQYTVDPTHYVNVSQRASIYWEQHFWSTHVSFLWSYTFQCENEDIVVELVRILNNLTADDLPAGMHWHNLMDDFSSDMMRFLKRVVETNDGSAAPCCDDLKLEVTIWLGELCTSKECCCWLVNVLDEVNHIFTQSFVRREDDDMSIEILNLYQQLLLHEETRFQVIGGDGIIDAIVSCLDKGERLGAAAGMCLILIQELDRNRDGSLGEVGCYIREKRFEVFTLADDDNDS